MPIFLRWIGHFSPVYVLNIGRQNLADSENIKIVWIVNLFIWFLLLLIATVCLNKFKNRFGKTTAF